MRKMLFIAPFLAIWGALVVGSGAAEARIKAVTDKFATVRGQKMVIRIGDLLDNDVCTQRCRKPLQFLQAFRVEKTKGTVKVRNNRIIFTPYNRFTGVTLFRYKIAGRYGIARDSGVVRIRVTPSPGGRGPGDRPQPGKGRGPGDRPNHGRGLGV